METLPFREKVLQFVAQVPKGKTVTYKQVAEHAGHPKAARAVGNIMRQNYDPAIPCHRVIRSDGKIGNYNRGGAPQKVRLLRKEGALLQRHTPAAKNATEGRSGAKYEMAYLSQK